MEGFGPAQGGHWSFSDDGAGRLTSFGLCGSKEATLPIHQPKTTFDYSGGSFTVVELMLELETGASFAGYAETNVLTPILGAAAVSKVDTSSLADMGGGFRGHRRKGTGIVGVRSRSQQRPRQ